MALTTLKDDLLHEFREERIMISEQIELLDPLATSLRKPAAQRLISSGALIIAEVGCYLASLGGIAFTAFMHKVYPFTIMERIYFNAGYRAGLGGKQLLYFILSIYGLALTGVILLFIIGRIVREVRLKNDILHMAGKDIKTIVGQHLERKAALEAIEQRHLLGISGVSLPPSPPPQQQSSVQTPAMSFRVASLGSVNEIPNPGY